VIAGEPKAILRPTARSTNDPNHNLCYEAAMNTPSNSTRSPRRALVIGASVAGLLAARVLNERYAEVVLLERDALPDRPSPRKGTPHAVHPHGLLARGRQILDELFPGFTEALVAQGGLNGDIGTEVAVDANGSRFARSPAGVHGLAVSRLAIEAELRRRVRALPGVRLLTEVDVLAPVHEHGRVVGVRWQRRDGSAAQTTAADLVIDCSGRGSRGPAWLREWGYEPPAEERVHIGLAYTSAYFRRAPGPPSVAGVIGTATAQLPRPSILLAQEPGEDGQPRWVAGVGGYAGDHVETTREAMAERARQTHSPEICALAEGGQIIGVPMRYGFPYSQRRHYQKLRRFPRGYLAMGDALASFNPIYGQGMTVAASEALALRAALVRGSDGLAPRFFKAAAHVIDTPWQLAVGGDLALPQVSGPRPFPVKLINAYVARVQRVAVHDAVVAAAFVKVMHMLAPPPSLLAPALLWRVWRGERPGATPATTAATV
jgi:2-polyprenyl-6-methoxyphenol hydroxylase-like FAD-dependent oxidoreductase